MAKFNLVIYHRQHFQQIADFLTVRNMMIGRAPDIDVHIISQGATVPADFWPRLAERPTLIFSPLPVDLDATARGARLVGHVQRKLKDIELLTGAGFPVPRTVRLLPDTVIDADRWGPFTVLKPIRSRAGEGVRLVRTRDVRWRDPISWPKEDPRHGKDLMAQQYVHPGPHSANFRVFSVLGRPLYSIRTMSTQKLPELDPEGRDPVELDVAANGAERKVELNFDEEVISLARAIHARLPQFPVMGLDIIRRHETGELFVLEINPGDVWHLSSNYGLRQQRQYGLDYYNQFNALRILTEAFIDATRRLAV